MDWNGAFFSLMALGMYPTSMNLNSTTRTPQAYVGNHANSRTLIVAQNTFDVLGGVLYIIW